MGNLIGCKVRSLLLCALLLALPALAAAQSNFQVDAKRGWQGSSIVVQQGQGLSFVVTGGWTVDFRNLPYVGPQGYSPQVDSTIYQGCKLDPKLPYAVLLVRIGADDPSFKTIVGDGTFTAYK